MKKLLIAVLVGVPLVGCTEKVVTVPGPDAPAGGEQQPGQTTDGNPTDPGTTPTTPTEKPATLSPDACLDGQDMDAADVDVKACPAIPEIPEDTKVNGKKVSLGAWEIGTTADGDTYKYGTLSDPASLPRTLEFEGGSVKVDDKNLECWAKGYYRLRKILQNAPKEWVALRDAGFQYRFFQFQTDLRNGPTGYKQISSFQDHLVKWVTVLGKDGVCQQPTLSKFRAYAKGELEKRGLPVPTN